MNKKFLLLFFGVCVIVGVAAFLYTRKSSPLPNSLPENNNIGTAVRTLALDGVSPLSTVGPVGFYFNIPYTTFPQTVSVFSASSIAPEKACNDMAKALEISSSCVLSDGLYRSGDAKRSVEIPLAFPLLTLSTVVEPAPSIPEPQPAAESFLSLFKSAGFLSDHVSLVFRSSSLLGDDGYESYPVETAREASVLGLDFSFLVDGFPLLKSDKSIIRFSGVADGTGIYHFSTPLPPIISPVGTVSVPPISQAIKQLRLGKGLLVNVENPSYRSLGLSTLDFSSVTFSSVQISYVWFTESNALVPAFLFSGVSFGGDTPSSSAQYLVSFSQDPKEEVDN